MTTRSSFVHRASANPTPRRTLVAAGAAAAVAAALASSAAIADDKTPAKPTVVDAAAKSPAPSEPVLTLRPGDKAPSLDIAHWVKGPRLAQFEPGKVAVVEFWATWCPPCRTSMPHLSELQKKYAGEGVSILGISDEPLEKVSEFLGKPEWAEKTQYTLATDPDRSVYRDYMKAALQQGIPTAFVIGKDGVVQWIGHPMEMDEPLAKIVKSEWDVKAARASFEKAMAMEAARMKADAEFRTAMQAGEWDKACAILDRQAAMDSSMATFFLGQKFELMLLHSEPAKTYAFGRELLATHGEDVPFLNQLSWAVVDNEGVKVRDLDFALEVATKANTLSGGKNAAVLDTLARVYWEKGDKAKAIETQKKAAENAPDNQMGQQIRETLEKYRGGK